MSSKISFAWRCKKGIHESDQNEGMYKQKKLREMYCKELS